jgi:hypothetical protein
MRKEFGGYRCKHLYWKGHGAVIPTERYDCTWFSTLAKTQEVREGHLYYSQHASPSCIWGIMGGWKELFDVGSVYHSYVLVVVSDSRTEDAFPPTCEHKI